MSAPTICFAHQTVAPGFEEIAGLPRAGHYFRMTWVTNPERRETGTLRDWLPYDAGLPEFAALFARMERAIAKEIRRAKDAD